MKYAHHMTTLLKNIPKLNEAIAENDTERIADLAAWMGESLGQIKQEAREKMEKPPMIYAHIR